MQHRHIINISGGKDSTALLLHALERETTDLVAVFADTGHEHPATYDYVHDLARRTAVPIRWVRADFSAQLERWHDRWPMGRLFIQPPFFMRSVVVSLAHWCNVYYICIKKCQATEDSIDTRRSGHRGVRCTSGYPSPAVRGSPRTSMKSIRIPLSGTYIVDEIFESELPDMPTAFSARSRIMGTQVIVALLFDEEHQCVFMFSRIRKQRLDLVRAKELDPFEACVTPESGHIFVISVPRPAGSSVTAKPVAAETKEEFHQAIGKDYMKKRREMNSLKEALRNMGISTNSAGAVKPRPRLYLVGKPTESDESNGQW